MDFSGTAIDAVEAVVDRMDDPESRPAGSAEPHYTVSDQVTVSRDHGIYVYHLRDDQLGQGSSFGNARAWAETKGFGQLLSLFSIETGVKVTGGMSLAYLLPFPDPAACCGEIGDRDPRHNQFSKTIQSAVGQIHLHPAFQQREYVIGDGLHVLETFFLPRTGMTDSAAAVQTTFLTNNTPHPISVTIVASLAMRGETARDLAARYDSSDGVLVAWNGSKSERVRVFGASDHPDAYWATTDEEEAYSPKKPLPNLVDETGDLIGAVQYNFFLMPGKKRKLRLVLAFSPHGQEEALQIFRSVQSGSILKKTIEHYVSLLNCAVIELPDDLLTHGVQWAKTNLLRPLSRYKVGDAFTNDPGNSSNLVGRDTAWYVYGSDLVNPDASCALLRLFAHYQNQNGLVPEYIHGITGQSEDNGFNINDDTPLFVMAVAHHIKATGHWHCLEALYETCKKAAELILSCRDENSLIKCTADGLGPEGICGWRNVLQNEQISGVVTEVNSECYAALRELSDLAEMSGCREDQIRYSEEAESLRLAINTHLMNNRNGFYIRNIDLSGRRYSQASSDLVFPLICGVSDDKTTRRVVARLSDRDFMTEAGIRVLPSGNPHYDPSFESGCVGGVWPGVTWWYAMSAAKSEPKLLAESLKRAYLHYITDPKTYNTVPGQFSEWSDGQTLVNRGMRLSPWEAPRFIWAAIEGLAGIKLGINSVALEPELPPDWTWLRLHNVRYRDGQLSYFLTREQDGMHVYTANSFETQLIEHLYEEVIPDGLETVTTGIAASAFRKAGELLFCAGNNQESPTMGPILAHRAVNSRKHYDVSHLHSHEGSWESLGCIKGLNLMRLSVRIEARGFALFRLQEKR